MKLTDDEYSSVSEAVGEKKTKGEMSGNNKAGNKNIQPQPREGLTGK